MKEEEKKKPIRSEHIVIPNRYSVIVYFALVKRMDSTVK